MPPSVSRGKEKQKVKGETEKQVERGVTEEGISFF
jgi:hypothetical protein